MKSGIMVLELAVSVEKLSRQQAAGKKAPELFLDRSTGSNIPSDFEGAE
jgi:hypothetical protein